MNFSNLKLSIRHNVKDHPQIEINGVLYINKVALLEAQHELKTHKRDVRELILENLLLRQWIDFFRGTSPEPEEKLPW